MRRDRGVILILSLVIFLLFLFKEYAESSINEKDEQYVVIEQKISTLTDENKKLKQELYTEESYQTIASKAAQLGLTQEPYYVVK